VTKQLKTEQPAARRGPGRPRHDGPSPKFLARRDEIITAAAKVFGEKGFDAGTLEDVGEAANLRGPTLYHYIDSKAHLLYLIFERTLDIAHANIEERLGHIADPRERLAELIRCQVEMSTRESDFMTVFYDQRPRLDPQHAKQVRARERKYLNVFVSAVAAAADAGVIEVTDVVYAAVAIHTMTTWVYKELRPGDSTELLAENCVSLILGRWSAET
jgi:TetR/AcrR family transcriptional regulator, cholesterol catabolism regulator